MSDSGGEMRFSPLTVMSLEAGTGYQRPYYYAPSPVHVDSPALEVMTDLKFEAAATVAADADVDHASQSMIARRVRMLLVVDSGRDVVGLVTARDLLGGRVAERTRGGSVAEARVEDIMTDAGSIEVLRLEDVMRARVGDVVLTLKHSGRQHALVVDHDAASGKPTIRGVFSASQIARQLGVAMPSTDLTTTFAEIEAAMSIRSGLG